MVPIDFSGKVALVTGVGDNESFAWFIAKALQAAGSHQLSIRPRCMRTAARPTTTKALAAANPPPPTAEKIP